MSEAGTAKKAATSIDIGQYGKLSIAPDAKAPLLVVFGGKAVHLGGKKDEKTASGVYMWRYMSSIQNRYHVFVSSSNHVNGAHAYRDLMKAIKDNKAVTPSKQILYLFSGGYGPGRDLLGSDRFNSKLFTSIYLVDIWMGWGEKEDPKVESSTATYYEKLADTDSGKMIYVYTKGGAVNDHARDYIAKKVGAKATFVKGSGMDDHMGTNTTAVRMLP